jgi:glutamate synthase (NADPH/NADH) large chain
VAGDAPAAAGATPAEARHGWFWQVISPDMAESGPGRLEPALNALAKPPPGQGVAAPRLSDLLAIAKARQADLLLTTVGTRVSSHIVRRFGMRNTLQPDHLTVKLTGSAGQSLGAFAAPGLKIEVSGDANDYVGKGLSGGTIVVRPPMASPLKAEDNTIIGNTVLYGATDGYLFAAGRAGERFAVRNSGAKVVIEGCGSNGCEYMTGGVAVILGRIGANFGAGMTGGMAYIHDPDRTALDLMNLETLVTCPVTVPYWEDQLKALIERHARETRSVKADRILANWAVERGNFLQICPKEMLVHIPHPLTIEQKAVPAE